MRHFARESLAIHGSAASFKARSSPETRNTPINPFNAYRTHVAMSTMAPCGGCSGGGTMRWIWRRFPEEAILIHQGGPHFSDSLTTEAGILRMEGPTGVTSVQLQDGIDETQ